MISNDSEVRILGVEFIRKRITDLRLKKGVSEYKMSLDLGHSRSYIQNIIAGRSLPSIEEFLYICEYLNVTPKAFFDDSEAEPILIQKALDGMRGLPDKDLLMLIGLIDRLKEGKSE
ncbi:MAG: XRE family transcriptional regulator [Desulfosporosinus sp. BICA1-9]|nr:MAG: XRE family transcriptional regulator [Desulfosporosinus sp. BICA1-9]